MTAKKVVTISIKYLSEPERSYWGLSNNGIFSRLFKLLFVRYWGKKFGKTAELAKKTTKQNKTKKQTNKNRLKSFIFKG